MISTYLLIQNHIIEGPKTLTHMDELQESPFLSASQKYQDSAEEQKGGIRRSRLG